MRAQQLTLLRAATRCSPRLLRAPSAALRASSTSSSSSPSPSSPSPSPSSSSTSSSPSPERTWSTPLAQFLGRAITTTGPISVAAYMRQCLTSELGGYYTRAPTPGQDQFGSKGDFVTSPEISQVFGELIAIWLYAEWLAQGRHAKVHIIEVGPGRGTLMDDVLRTIASFKPFAHAIDTIYLVEASPHLQKKQAKLLAGTEELQTSDVGLTAPCKYIPGCNIQWCEDIRFVPKDETSTPFILAHEFFDALPIHVFQNVPQSSIPAASTIMTPTGPITPKHGPSAPGNVWHELVVSPTNPFAEAPPAHHHATADKPDFEMTISKSPTPHSLYLPTMSPRYKKLDKTDDAIIEVSPESLAYAADFAVRIGGETPKPAAAAAAAAASQPPSNQQQQQQSHDASQPSSPAFKTPEARSALRTSKTPPPPPFTKRVPTGAALILDYGTSSAVPANTLRGIRAHKPVSPFVTPGLVDLSADVDFVALAEAGLKASEGVEVHGPVEQAFFLQAMGIRERAGRLLEAAGDEVVKERLDAGWKRLVDRGDEGMGRIYKVMAFLPYVEGRPVRRPVGFGGGVVG